MNKIDIKIDIHTDVEMTVSDLLAAKSGLSKSKVKDAMNKGAVWLKKKRGGMKRLRKATAMSNKGDHIELHYDETILLTKPGSCDCLSDRGVYSVWYKPPGMMAQGTIFGDHCSLIRQAVCRYSSSKVSNVKRKKPRSCGA